MKSLIGTSGIIIIALAIAGFNPVLAGESQGTVVKKDPVFEACKGKKAGDTVQVDGKNVKCPDLNRSNSQK